MQKVAIKVHDWVGEVDVIITSPFVRAQQTAEILSQVFYQTKIIEAPELVPQSPPPAFLNWLKAHGRSFKKVIAVGHEPHLSTFLSYLLAGADHPIVEMKKAGVASLEVESMMGLAPATARLNWLIQPKLVLD
jgi:phosphohistidine phosphatase